MKTKEKSISEMIADQIHKDVDPTKMKVLKDRVAKLERRVRELENRPVNYPDFGRNQ